MTSPSDPNADPLSFRGLVAGVTAGGSAWMLSAFLDSLHHGDPATGLLFLFALALVPIATLVYGLLGWLVYARLRRAAPHAIRRGFCTWRPSSRPWSWPNAWSSRSGSPL